MAAPNGRNSHVSPESGHTGIDNLADVGVVGNDGLMNVVDPQLRLSAQRALIGAIHPDVRLVKVRRDGNRITFSAIFVFSFSDLALDALNIAATEIEADFPDCIVDEHIVGSADPLPCEDILAEGWVFCRAEG